MISYKEQADEYFDSANKIRKTINKYREQLKKSTPENHVNYEFVNDTIYRYRKIYCDLINTGNMLLRKSKEE